MGRKHRRLIEIGKDILIAVLALSAVYLTFRTQITNFAPQSGGWLGSLVQLVGGGAGQLLGPAEPEAPREVPVYPARVVVTNADLARYSVQYDTTATDEVFGRVFSVLGEALSSAESPSRVSEQTWREALSERPGVYFDFLGQYPLETLLSWLEQGAENAALTGTARRLLLAEDGNGRAVLYYHNAADGSYYACGTSGAVLNHLRSAVEGVGSNGLKYAFEYDSSEGLANLYPYVLLDTQPPSPPVYQVSNPLGNLEDQDAVWSLLSSMEALGFQSQSGTPYQPGSGEWVVNEGTDQLRISAGGTISFRTDEGAEARYPVLQAGESPTATELLDAVQPIAAGTIGERCGEARLYLIGLTELADGTWQADFGYSLNGAAVQLYSEGYAARFLIQNGAVVEFTLHFRSYTATGETSSVLPEVQAAAALGALEAEGGELVLCYEDSGGETVQAGWIAQ